MASTIQIAGKTLRYAAPILVVAVAVFGARALIAARKAPPKVERPARILPVTVTRPTLFKGAPTLESFGVVRPMAELSVRPIVGGPVLELHPNMIAGGRVARGEALFVIDPRDYELAVATAKATLAGAEADLAIEEGTAAVAESEWKLLGGAVETTEAGRSLALREPYVAKRRAEVASARAQVEQAELNLERATVRAPFDALILSETLEIGSQVSAGTEVARIVDTAAFMVEVTVPAARMSALQFSEAPARVQRSDAPAGQASQAGELLRLTGEVDPAGRMARAQVALKRPLEGPDPMLLGSYVRVELPLRSLGESLVIPRAALHEGDVVWLVDAEDRLEIRAVTVGLRRDEDVLLVGGVTADERVILSPIAVPLPGMKLRILGDSQETAPESPASQGSMIQRGADQ